MGLVLKIARYFYFILFHHKYGEFHKTSYLGKDVYIRNKKNLFLSEYTNISAHAKILNGRAPFVMKKYSGAAIGLLVVTGSHLSVVGKPFKFVKDSDKDKLDINHEYDKAVIVEEDVWIGSNVVLMQGVVIGRGAVIGAGSVIRKSPPPYSIVAGNPAKVIGFRFTPEEILKHEEQLYPEKERLLVDILEKNYQKYYTGRVKAIKEFLKQ